MSIKSMNALLAAAVVTTLGGAGYVPAAVASGDTVSVAQSENAGRWRKAARRPPLRASAPSSSRRSRARA